MPFAMTAIKGMGLRYSHVVCKKANVDVTKRAGELSDEEVMHAPFYCAKSSRLASYWFPTMLLKTFILRLKKSSPS